jgi:hypothetical protein
LEEEKMAGFKELQLLEDKYTDAEAVAAVIAGDNYIKNDANDESTGTITAAGFKRVYNALEAATLDFQYSLATKDIDVFHGSGGMRLYKYHTHQSGMLNWGYKARGSRASPVVPILDDKIFGMGGGIWDGNSWVSAGQLLIKVDGTVTTTSTPTRVTIDTCPVGSQSMVERMAILNDGKIDMKDNIVKDPKNHALSALSGTIKLVEIDIGGVPYYFKVWPTKA